jgi:hypothetical protein
LKKAKKNLSRGWKSFRIAAVTWTAARSAAVGEDLWRSDAGKTPVTRFILNSFFGSGEVGSAQ